MDAQDLNLIENHVEKDSELKDLWDEHLRYKQLLDKLDRKPYLNPEEKVEKKRLQLAKLAGKTRIEGILSKYRTLQS